MSRIFKTSIAVLLCIFTFSAVQANELELKKKTSVFEIQGSGVPDSIMNVTNYCAEVWSQYIQTDVPIQVSVSWQELKSNVNAYAKPTTYFAIDGIYYPVALAEKIQHKNLNGANADIEVVINKNINWLIDEECTPIEKHYDLITTLIHELAHGLGYIGNIASENLETTDFPSPTIFDMLVADKNGTPIVTRKDGSFVLDNTVLTSNELYWNGRFAKAFCGENLKLYAPESFNSGSTVYHLDETTYESGSGKELMTPILRYTEIFRKPDIATIAMLADLGWSDYFVNHDELQNSEDRNAAQTISFYVNDTLLNKENQAVLYSFDEGNHFVVLPASFIDDENRFEATIPALAFDHTITYQIRSITENNDTLFLPAKDFFTVFVGDDTDAPVIEHTPITTTNKIDITISASITDNFGVTSAYIKYYVKRDNTLVLDTVKVDFECTTYSTEALIQLSAINRPFYEGDEIYYTIVATDKSGNTSYFFAENDYQKIVYEENLDPVQYFVTDFDDADISNSFLLDKCSITKVDGFSNNALHTQHPYAYTGVDGKYNQYTATLKYPIIIASNPATISFEEVVLVEPGKAGVDFGTFGFWDYVIVEGAKDINSDTWYALGKVGWDSQLSSIWKTRYYSNTKNDGDNENSLAIGDSTLFRSHTINMLENKYFRAGDTIYVRFRLQSDATNYAWGWAIDNLKIQERVSLAIPLVENTSSIYPNPCSTTLYTTKHNITSVRIFDAMGQLIMSSNQMPINVSRCKSGVYTIVLVESGGTIVTQQFVKE